MKRIFLLIIMLTLAACDGGAVETLSDEVIQTEISQIQAARPVDTRVPTDTLIPTETPPTETPEIPQSELIEKWEYPLFAITEVAGFCNYLLDTGGNTDSLEFFAVGFWGGVIFDSIGDIFVRDQVEYQEEISIYMSKIDQLYGQIDQGKITPEEFTELLGIECNATMDLRRKIAEAAKDEGLTEARIESIIKDAETFLDNVFESTENGE